MEIVKSFIDEYVISRLINLAFMQGLSHKKCRRQNMTTRSTCSIYLKLSTLCFQAYTLSADFFIACKRSMKRKIMIHRDLIPHSKLKWIKLYASIEIMSNVILFLNILSLNLTNMNHEIHKQNSL